MPNNLVMRIPNNKIALTISTKEQSQNIQQNSQYQNIISSRTSTQSVKFPMSLNIVANSFTNSASNSKGCGCK
tara:strand:+ start:2126 stop:2344 length:219 start_codon:yes stop_codon:yes gene_type:complete